MKKLIILAFGHRFITESDGGLTRLTGAVVLRVVASDLSVEQSSTVLATIREWCNAIKADESLWKHNPHIIEIVD